MCVCMYGLKWLPTLFVCMFEVSDVVATSGIWGHCDYAIVLVAIERPLR